MLEFFCCFHEVKASDANIVIIDIILCVRENSICRFMVLSR